MNKMIYIIIGIVTFILILCSSFMNVSSSDSESNVDNTQGNVDTNQQTTEKINGIVYKGKFPLPIENFIKVTSKFGLREAHGVVHSNHTGIDLCGSVGSRIMSVQDGIVTHAGWQGGYGNSVEIKHTDELGNVFFTFYAHMRNDSICVQAGQSVTLGQVIGIQGSTGNSTGDHLHFELRTNGGSNSYAVDPVGYLFTEI